MRRQQASDAPDDGFKYLDLAVQIETPGSFTAATAAVRAVTVLFHQRLDPRLEVRERFVLSIMLRRTRRQEGERRKAVDQGQGIVSQRVIELDVRRIIPVSGQRCACDGPDLVFWKSMFHVIIVAVIEHLFGFQSGYRLVVWH